MNSQLGFSRFTDCFSCFCPDQISGYSKGSLLRYNHGLLILAGEEVFGNKMNLHLTSVGQMVVFFAPCIYAYSGRFLQFFR
ncbi:hypothetical protein COW36_03045 [bacterium (Candidatus Blackallbacteria) CG17_big_fil_post_rev_8_21_14_2_50_48_46]|uniref:Uncharacterized protein n=1 Tax=bacterium (Candidatus Blackallbacteria) CG17_big_fil_post_rev_8_21_14_2_50_48_46 TaxID=2014261 RepID=A0A2M7GAD0_9BACT|nr:MAG: hypothetical protein COW64_12430 [bacterium (Candidatus Blackallbacteria) CG18_big_fil_WC_8_21_14_2_50_49_26]PIW19103.1 MAG: hypothetical protein COW36_03045 [bacterium (Candidatus Blackallbacteria) CG17_big_fil_post_rev_8_21_14_2_50_48_46]PIW44530.1 MAG: hypothetical protein COW20_23075 [bacterium (Candidatus Blackallbacteria) CG13_big_fil_rev_8_21_14_2_50_49_14]